MPSFDVVSEINWVEMQNALDQSEREIASRFDFKDSRSAIHLDPKQKILTIESDDDFKLAQVYDIVIGKMGKRGVDTRVLQSKAVEKIAGNRAKQIINIQEGIDSTLAKTIVKHIKDSGLKLQASIQGDTVRVSGAKKDALQSSMALLKNKIDSLPLQFNNFRD